MVSEILTVAEMYAADRYAADHGVPSLTLMENAGSAVADAICARWTPREMVVLCGPGNNGGDGFVVARLLKERGWPVRVALLGSLEALRGDAAEMAKRWSGATTHMDPASIDGAGLSRPIEGIAHAVVEKLNKSDAAVVAVDVPSGLHGDLGKPLETF